MLVNITEGFGEFRLLLAEFATCLGKEIERYSLSLPSSFQISRGLDGDFRGSWATVDQWITDVAIPRLV
jgi:hypothetical protein